MKAKVLSIIIASFYAIQAHAQLGYWYHNSFIELQAIDKSVLFVKNNALKDFNIDEGTIYIRMKQYQRMYIMKDIQ